MIRYAGIFAVALFVCLVFSPEDAEARRYRSYRGGKFGSARPATGYGSNIHRNFVLKQEARRASQGKRVRNRGNILWYR